MKNLYGLAVGLLSLGALAGCADDNGPRTVSQNQSAAMSGDSKDMTSRTTTTTETVPAAQTEKSTDTDNSPSYPAIHSNGQGAGM